MSTEISSKEKIKEVIRQICSDPAMDIQDEMTIFVQLKLDSLDFVELVQETEQSLGVQLEVREFFETRPTKNLKGVTLAEFVQFVDSKWLKEAKKEE